MKARKVQIKLFVEWPRELDFEPFVPAFHRFIQEKALDEMLVDVAQYGHVHEGPAVLLVGHGSDYALDFAEGRAGLLYSRKREAPEDARACVTDGLRRALVAAKKLEEDKTLPQGLRFKTDELLFRLNDRLLAPNDAATFVTVEPVLKGALSDVFPGATLSLERKGTLKELFTVSVKATNGKKATVSELLSRIS
jgi:hypothetical protein